MQCKHWLMLEHLQSSKERKGEVKQIAKRSIQDKQGQDKELTFGSFRSLQVFSTFSTQGDEFLHQCLTREKHVSIWKAQDR
jgi:hypothetical protein